MSNDQMDFGEAFKDLFWESALHSDMIDIAIELNALFFHELTGDVIDLSTELTDLFHEPGINRILNLNILNLKEN